MGGFVLANVTTMGGLFPALFATTLLAAAAYLLLTPTKEVRNYEDGRTTETRKRNYKTRLVDMGKSIIRELAKAAPITVLFHTVGIDALSL